MRKFIKPWGKNLENEKNTKENHKVREILSEMEERSSRENLYRLLREKKNKNDDSDKLPKAYVSVPNLNRKCSEPDVILPKIPIDKKKRYSAMVDNKWHLPSEDSEKKFTKFQKKHRSTVGIPSLEEKSIDNNNNTGKKIQGRLSMSPVLSKTTYEQDHIAPLSSTSPTQSQRPRLIGSSSASELHIRRRVKKSKVSVDVKENKKEI